MKVPQWPDSNPRHVYQSPYLPGLTFPMFREVFSRYSPCIDTRTYLPISLLIHTMKVTIRYPVYWVYLGTTMHVSTVHQVYPISPVLKFGLGFQEAFSKLRAPPPPNVGCFLTLA